METRATVNTVTDNTNTLDLSGLMEKLSSLSELIKSDIAEKSAEKPAEKPAENPSEKKDKVDELTETIRRLVSTKSADTSGDDAESLLHTLYGVSYREDKEDK